MRRRGMYLLRPCPRNLAYLLEGFEATKDSKPHTSSRKEPPSYRCPSWGATNDENGYFQKGCPGGPPPPSGMKTAARFRKRHEDTKSLDDSWCLRVLVVMQTRSYPMGSVAASLGTSVTCPSEPAACLSASRSSASKRSASIVSSAISVRATMSRWIRCFLSRSLARE
jgi:hypothetical protein